MSAWLALSLGSVVTYALRASFLFLLGARRLPGRVERTLGLVAPAVLAALVVPVVLFEGGSGPAALAPGKTLAALAAGVVAWRTRSVPWTLAAGLAVLWTLRALD